MIGRPYSFVNPPGAAPHEFYFIVVPGGPLSPRLAALVDGDPVWLAPRANGFFSVGEVPPADVLWCLSTGTGIGPFLSMLRTDELVDAFRARRARPRGAPRRGTHVPGHDRRHRGRTRGRVHVRSDGEPRRASGRAVPGGFPRRSTDGRLEMRAGIPLSPENAQAMLCGNPAMVEDTQKVLATRGMRRHRRKEPGHVTVETYW